MLRLADFHRRTVVSKVKAGCVTETSPRPEARTAASLRFVVAGERALEVLEWAVERLRAGDDAVGFVVEHDESHNRFAAKALRRPS
jgi:hypothetical protein